MFGEGSKEDFSQTVGGLSLLSVSKSYFFPQLHLSESVFPVSVTSLQHVAVLS